MEKTFEPFIRTEYLVVLGDMVGYEVRFDNFRDAQEYLRKLKVTF